MGKMRFSNKPDEKTIRHRVFWLFEQYEKWLGEMSLEGFELVGISWLGAFEFRCGVPAERAYGFFIATHSAKTAEETAAMPDLPHIKKRGPKNFAGNPGFLVCENEAEAVKLSTHSQRRYTGLRSEYKWEAAVSAICALLFFFVALMTTSGPLFCICLAVVALSITVFAKSLCNLALIDEKTA